MKTATITHENIAANGWAFLAADVFTRVDAFKADEERQMRECMGNRDNYTIEEIRAVIAHHERNGSTRRANIARAVLAERTAEAAAETMNAGDKATYLGRARATILGKTARGYRIEYWGQGAREGELIRATVPARDLTPIN